VAALSKPAAKPRGRGKSTPNTVCRSAGSSTTSSRAMARRTFGARWRRASQSFIITWMRSGGSWNIAFREAWYAAVRMGWDTVAPRALVELASTGRLLAFALAAGQAVLRLARVHQFTLGVEVGLALFEGLVDVAGGHVLRPGTRSGVGHQIAVGGDHEHLGVRDGGQLRRLQRGAGGDVVGRQHAVDGGGDPRSEEHKPAL